MAAILRRSWSLMGALPLVLFVLARASLSSASNFADLDASLPPVTGPPVSFPPLPSLPRMLLGNFPQLSLPPLPSSFKVPDFTSVTLPPVEPFVPLHLPPSPQPSATLLEDPEISSPSTTVLPPLGSLPAFRNPVQTFAAPPLPTIPDIPTFSAPPTSFPLPRRASSHKQAIKN